MRELEEIRRKQKQEMNPEDWLVENRHHPPQEVEVGGCGGAGEQVGGVINVAVVSFQIKSKSNRCSAAPSPCSKKVVGSIPRVLGVPGFPARFSS